MFYSSQGVQSCPIVGLQLELGSHSAAVSSNRTESTVEAGGDPHTGTIRFKLGKGWHRVDDLEGRVRFVHRQLRLCVSSLPSVERFTVRF